jgi:hypothetical protein
MRMSTISLLINRQFRENIRIYGIGILVLFGMLSFMFLLIHQWQDSFSGAVQNGVFIIGLFVSGGIFTNSMFHEFSNSSSSIWLLSLPAKQIEKFIASIFISTVLFLLAYLTIFYLVESIYLLNTKGLEFKNMLNPIKDDFYIFFFLYLLFNGSILLGRVVFIKHSLLKTLLVGILLFICLNYLNNVILEILIPNMNVVSSIPFDSFQFSNNGENIHVFLPTQTDRITAIFVRLILPVSLWFLVWMKFKEKQI